MIELVPFSARGDRIISRFHAEELLYEYVQGTLDPIRAAGVKSVIDQDPKLKLEIEGIRRALAYCDTLGRVEFSPAHIDQIRTETTAFDHFLKKMKVHEWPGGIRVGMESLFVVSLVFFFAMMVPWNTLISVLQENRGTLVLSEVSKELQTPESKNDFPVVAQKKLPADQQAKNEGADTSAFDDEGVPREDLAGIKKPVESLTAIGAPTTLSPLDTKIAAPTPTTVLPPTAAPVDKKPDLKERVAAAREPAAKGNSEVRSGWLHKGRLSLTNVASVTPKLVEAVSSLGGRKAGQVPLGWAKGKGSYFHFTIPEAKYEELLSALKNFGTLKITRDPHDRVMPEGIVRVIIDVEEASSGTKKEAVEFIPDPSPAGGSQPGAESQPQSQPAPAE